MKHTNTIDRTRDSQLARASTEDMSELLKLATDLRSLSVGDKANRDQSRTNVRLQLLLTGFAIIVTSLLISTAQSSLPGNALYSAKLVSERVAVYANPEFKENVMMRRAQETQILASQHAPSPLVRSALKGYVIAMKEYKKTDTSHSISSSPVLQFCLAKLRAAETVAADDTKPEIARTIHVVESLDT